MPLQPVFPRLARQLILLVCLCAACTRQVIIQPVSPPPAATRAPTRVAALSPAPTPSVTPAPTPSGPTTLSLCLPREPESLYRFGLPDPGREHLLAALDDGPIDAVQFGFQPVLLTELPSPANAGAQLESVPVAPGDLVMDALGRLQPLAAGTLLRLPDGALAAYASGPLNLPRWRVRFHLLPGLRWSDGQPLTADDSVFAFELSASAYAFGLWHARAGRTQAYRALDAATVEWLGLPGDADPLAPTFFWPPEPRHAYASLTPEQISDDERSRHAPICWVPFQVSEWVAGQQVTLERNPYYFRANEGLPRLRQLVFRFIPGDAAALLAEVQAGRCELAPANALFAAQPDFPARLAGLPGAQLLAGTSARLEWLAFDLAPADGRAPLLAEPRLRQALAACLDRSALPVAAGPPPDSYLPADHPDHAPNLAAHPFDPAVGQALLTELGWADVNGDGLREWGGAAAQLELVAGPLGDLWREALAADLAAQWQAHCGLPVTVRLLTRAELEGDWPAGVVFGRRFDLALLGARADALSPCEFFLSEQLASDANPAGANPTGYAQADFDAACRRASDPAAAITAQALFARDLPGLPLLFRPRWAAAHRPIAGLALDPSAASELWNVELWTLP